MAQIRFIPYAQAKDFVLMFGKNKGKSLDKIAETDDGLLYLDWLSGEHWVDVETKAHLLSYLAGPTIAKDVASVCCKWKGE